jgi:hypothetical protein
LGVFHDWCSGKGRKPFNQVKQLSSWMTRIDFISRAYFTKGQ